MAKSQRAAQILAPIAIICALLLAGCASEVNDPQLSLPSTKEIIIEGDSVFQDRWQVLSPGVVETDPDFSATTLTVTLLRLDNAIGGDARIEVTLEDGTRCRTERLFSVYKPGGGTVRLGETGSQELTCDRFVTPEELVMIGTARANGS